MEIILKIDNKAKVLKINNLILPLVGNKIDTETTVPNVTNPITGAIWMDRNLGASQVATSSADVTSYGDLYQWGRGTDGHEKRNSGTTSTLSNNDTPGHGNFITSTNTPYDWRVPQNNELWQGENGTNNPCPCGYRLPTEDEWEAERQSWSSDYAAGAFASPLKLPMAGFRFHDGRLMSSGTYGIGFYWSSSVNARRLYFNYSSSSESKLDNYDRVAGGSVRCIKD